MRIMVSRIMMIGACNVGNEFFLFFYSIDEIVLFIGYSLLALRWLGETACSTVGCRD